MEAERTLPEDENSMELKREEEKLFPDETSKKREMKRIMINIFLISIAFLMNFNAFQGLSRLQSTLHKDENMGTINSSVLYGALVISCMFVPKPLIHAVGHKWTIPLCFSGYLLWIGANGYAVWATMVPASVIVGLVAAPLWTAQCAYFTLLGERYARLSGLPTATIISKFFGIFFMFFQMSSITGSIISSTVLNPSEDKKVLPGPEQLAYCGVRDCPHNPDMNVTEDEIEEKTVWTMLGIYIGIAVLAILLVCLFVDPLPKELVGKTQNACKNFSLLLSATLRHLGDCNQLLLIAMTMYSGFEQAAFAAEFTRSFVTCSIGIWSVGLVTIPFGVVNAIVSLLGGHLIKYTGRPALFIAGMLVDLAIQITLMRWMPTPDERYVLYVLASLWGLTDGIWQTQINALYGSLFTSNPEAAFSNYRMWESLGFIVAFAYSGFLCTEVKLFILTGMLGLGMAGYCAVELRVRSASRADRSTVVGNENKAYAYPNDDIIIVKM